MGSLDHVPRETWRNANRYLLELVLFAFFFVAVVVEEVNVPMPRQEAQATQAEKTADSLRSLAIDTHTPGWLAGWPRETN